MNKQEKDKIINLSKRISHLKYLVENGKTHNIRADSFIKMKDLEKELKNFRKKIKKNKEKKEK